MLVASFRNLVTTIQEAMHYFREASHNRHCCKEVSRYIPSGVVLANQSEVRELSGKESGTGSGYPLCACKFYMKSLKKGIPELIPDSFPESSRTSFLQLRKRFWPKSQKSQKRVKKEPPEPSRPRGPKSPKRVKNESKMTLFDSFLTLFWTLFGLFGPVGPECPGDSFLTR